MRSLRSTTDSTAMSRHGIMPSLTRFELETVLEVVAYDITRAGRRFFTAHELNRVGARIPRPRIGMLRVSPLEPSE